jgi:phage terminase small subunit
MTGKLTDKQKRFCDEYLANGMNATQAAISAGYSVKTARSQGQRMLTNVDIAQYLGQRQNGVAQKLELSFERHALEYARLAYSDVRGLYNDDGSLKDPQDWDDDLAAAVASVETLEERDRETKEVTGWTRKVKLHSKTAALADAGKHLGFFEKDNKQRNAAFDLSALSATEKLQFLQLLTKTNKGA